MTTAAPSLQEFLVTAHREFQYLLSDYGFSLGPAGRNPYSVLFTRGHTTVQIEGIAWGTAVNVILSHENQRVPLWAVARARGVAPEPAASGQLEQLRDSATLLKRVAEEVLKGNAGVFPSALQAMHEANVEANRPRTRRLP